MADMNLRDQALAYMPVLLNKLDIDTLPMFAAVMQAQRDGGYADGFKDAHDLSGGKNYSYMRSILSGLLDVIDGSSEPGMWDPDDKHFYDAAKQLVEGTP